MDVAANRISAQVIERLSERLANEYSFTLVQAQELEISIGHNNRVLCLHSAEGRMLIAKTYFSDGRRRLAREYGALTLLQERGIGGVPKPVTQLEDLNLGVYTFEPGVRPAAADLSTAQVVEVAHRLARMVQIRPGEPGTEGIAIGVGAVLPLAEHLALYQRRLRLYRTHAERAPESWEVTAARTLLDADTEVALYMDRALQRLTPEAIQTPLPEAKQGFSPCDQAPHNLLVRPEGVTLLDFEYSGWDDPVAVPAAFVTAETSTDLPVAQAGAFLNAFWAGAQLTDEDVARYETLSCVFEVSWLSVHLAQLTPEALAAKHFAAASFDTDGYRRLMLDKLAVRLDRVRRLLD